MTKDEAQVIWAAASEYRWRGFDHWWEERERYSKVELDREAIAESKIDTETFVDMVEKRISKNKQQINNEADRLYFDAIWRAKNE